MDIQAITQDEKALKGFCEFILSEMNSSPDSVKPMARAGRKILEALPSAPDWTRKFKLFFK